MKRILALLLALLCLIPLMGCDDTGDPTGTASEPVTQTDISDLTTTDEKTGTATDKTEPHTDTTAENTAEQKNTHPSVSAAVDYTKSVVCTLPGATVDDLSIKEHIIRIPKIDSDAPGAKALNKKILDTYSENHELLKQNKEDSLIFTTVFRSAYWGDILQVAVVCGEFVQFSEGMSHTEVYYYDPENDKELTADQFLSLSGLDWKKIEAAIRANPDSLFLMGEESDPPYTVRLQTLYLDPENEHYCTVQVQHDFGEYSDLGIYFFSEDQVKTFRK